MSGIEDLVTSFLDERELDPTLRPEAFLASRGAAPPGALAAMQRALELERLLAEPTRESREPLALPGVRIVREIGAGGMGRVFEVDRGGETLALKILQQARLVDARAARRFRREADVLRRLDHPGIVKVFEAGTDASVPWLLMEKIDGRALSEVETPLAPEPAARLVSALSDAVEAVHAAGLVHRDIKPSNIVLREDGRPVLLDFGMALVDDGSTLTLSGDQLGTPRYMAPEQVRGEPADGRTDVHALGLLLYELLTGRPARPQETREAVLGAAVRGPPRPSAVSSSLPSALDRIVRQASARHREFRYATARELDEDLTRFLEGETVAARPPGRLRCAVAAVRERPAPVVLGVVLLAVALIVGIGLGRGTGSSRAEIEKSFDRGLAAWAAGHELRARKHLDHLARIAPDDPRTERLSSLLAGPGDAASLDRVTELLLAARRQLDRRKPAEAFRLAREAAELQPESAQAAALVARAASAPEELAWADDWTSALGERRRDSSLVAGARGRILAKLGRNDDAETELRRGLDLDPEAAALHHVLAIHLDDSGRSEEAAVSAREAARLTRGESRPVLNNLAAFLDKIGETEEAERIYRDLTRRFPASYKAWFNLAYTLDRQSRVAEARPLYEKCLELHPGQLDATLCLAWLLATADEAGVGDVDRAFDLLRSARRRHGASHPTLKRLIADVERRTGRSLDG